MKPAAAHTWVVVENYARDFTKMDGLKNYIEYLESIGWEKKSPMALVKSGIEFFFDNSNTIEIYDTTSQKRLFEKRIFTIDDLKKLIYQIESKNWNNQTKSTLKEQTISNPKKETIDDYILIQLSDKEFDAIFKAITDFDSFKNNLINKTSTVLSEEIKITFNSNSVKIAELRVYDKILSLSFSDVKRIIEILENELNIQKINTSLKASTKLKWQKSEELFKVSENTYLVYPEYIENMINCFQVSSLQNKYSDLLIQLEKVINNGNALTIENKKITNKIELTEYLKLKGIK